VLNKIFKKILKNGLKFALEIESPRLLPPEIERIRGGAVQRHLQIGPELLPPQPHADVVRQHQLPSTRFRRRQGAEIGAVDDRDKQDRRARLNGRQGAGPGREHKQLAQKPGPLSNFRQCVGLRRA
jgi:hypothetical protein